MAKVSTFTAVVARDYNTVTSPLSNATFVAFRNSEGLNPEGVVWERVDYVWRCVAWDGDGDDYAPGDVEDMEMELVDAVDNGVTSFYYGSDCSREEMFSYLFGHDAEGDGDYGTDYDYPPHMEAPVSMFAKDNWHSYAFTLDPKRVEEQERELREALVRADESVHEELYGSSYKA